MSKVVGKVFVVLEHTSDYAIVEAVYTTREGADWHALAEMDQAYQRHRRKAHRRPVAFAWSSAMGNVSTEPQTDGTTIVRPIPEQGVPTEWEDVPEESRQHFESRWGAWWEVVEQDLIEPIGH